MNAAATLALCQFAEAIKQKFSTHISGEPEDQIRAPFEQLVGDMAKALGIAGIIPVGETRLANGIGRPDYSVAREKLTCGYVELKAPGKGADASQFSGHDKKQWARFSNLPNIVYSDGHHFSLYRTGELIHRCSLAQDPRQAGQLAVDADSSEQLLRLLRDFFEWEPIVPSNAKQLATYLAPLCRTLRDDALDTLKNNVPAVVSAARDWRNYLFPGANDAQFADAYAQTVTFSLLLARSNGSDTLFIDDAVASLTHASSLLSRALQVLTDPLVKEHLGATLDMLMRVINKVPTGTMSGGRRDPWLNFYEDFLAEYDPKLRRDAGAYYTPVEVVKAQVCIVDDLLKTRFAKKFGFATGGVNVLDPAVGTGTYLLGVIEHTLEDVEKNEGPGAVAARADVLGGSLYGFEIMVGPYAVASLRLTRMLQQYGGHLPGDGTQIMLNNTLESPHEKIPELPSFYLPIGLEHKRAKRVKEAVPVLVCLGNPPYDRHEASTLENQAMTGAWVRWGESKNGQDAILKDFISPVIRAGKGGSLKNIYNLYVYFWRWALWKTFEHDLATGPGIVSFITANSFIDGDAFLGMRRHMRMLCDEIWIIDLGGEGRGSRQDENVFSIKTPVAITVAVRYGKSDPGVPAVVRYSRVEGSRASKLHKLESMKSLAELESKEASSDWEAPFRPAGSGDYFKWPLITDLMPWQQSGVKCGRTWVVAADRATLEKRVARLQASEKAERSLLFKDSPTGRKSGDNVGIIYPAPSEKVRICDLTATSTLPVIGRYSFRAFDRQYVVADGRFLDRASPMLWTTASEKQIYLASQFTSVLGSGSAMVASAEIPDLHFFAGRGAKDIVPLYRDSKATQPNIHPDLLPVLADVYQFPVSAEDFVSYTYGLLAQPNYSERFEVELENREVRLPLTSDSDLFKRIVSVGAELIYLHTYGERFREGQAWPASGVKYLTGIDSKAMPEDYAYDRKTKIIRIGSGEFGPVDNEIWEYEVSGLKVVHSWIAYRLANRKGKKSSPLDDITPAGWSSELSTEFIELLTILKRTVELQPLQAALLDEVVSGPLVIQDFSSVPEVYRSPPRASASANHDLEL